jgi:hypothetical protein
MEGEWKNPFGLYEPLTITKLEGGLGIVYSQFFSTGTPSNITLGGECKIDDFYGRLLIQTGTNPSEQLLIVKLMNLDVAQLFQMVGKMIDHEISLANGKDTFYVRTLEIYISTGVDVLDTYYARGIRLNADVTIFGKRAQLLAEVSEEMVKFKGTVERFSLDKFTVCGTKGDNTDPYVDIELSRAVQKIHIDGKITFHKNYVILSVHIDTGTGEFDVYFELVIGDDLKVIVKAKLEGPLPPPVKELEAPKPVATDTKGLVESAGKDLIKQQTGKLPGGGLLEGKTFTVYAKVEQNIVDYIVKIANEHLGNEDDPNTLDALKDKLDKALKALEDAEEKCRTKRSTLKENIDAATAKLDARAFELKIAREKVDSDMASGIAASEQKERDLLVQLAVSHRDLVEKERLKTLEIEANSITARNQTEEFRMAWKALDFARIIVEMTTDARDAAEADFAVFETQCHEHEDKEPAKDDPTHAPWEWMNADLKAQLLSQTTLHTATG